MSTRIDASLSSLGSLAEFTIRTPVLPPPKFRGHLQKGISNSTCPEQAVEEGRESWAAVGESEPWVPGKMIVY